MILATLAIDYLLHQLGMVYIGRYLGYAGTGIIILSFVYSLRKRQYIKAGSPKTYLMWHEYMAWGGSVMIFVHAGVHFNAILPWLAVIMLLVAVASGLVGKFLLKKANESLKEKKAYFAKEGLSKEEIEKKLFMDSVTVDLMKKWRVVHLPISLLVALLSLLHILSVFMYSA
ncbi:MAG: hypothetical protein JNL88_11715 [Bacteroidia bacterium]|nr:hypothetical protein [Bacteroidia bacterium]